MLPLILSVKDRHVVVAGRGLGAQQRYEFARDAGSGRLSLYVIDQDGWACHAEAALYERLPVKADLVGASVVFVAGLDAGETQHIVQTARAVGALVNAEDIPELCDFHVPSVVRRGELLLTASTGGTAPGLARHIGRHLSRSFGSEWAERAAEIARARVAWRAEGRTKAEIVKLTEALVEREGWLNVLERA